MITGEREVLSYLVESPDVPTISFTGSTTTGRAISQAGAARIKRFGLELGGKTPMVVFDDADVDAALPKLEKALTIFAGQFCMTGSRLLVQRGVADKLRRGLAARLEAVKVGPASDAASVWTRDADRPLRIARELEAGTIWINDWAAMRDEFEEGGYKQSGRGRLRGLASLDDFVEYKHIVLQPGVAATSTSTKGT